MVEQIWPDRLTDKCIVPLKFIAAEVKYDKSKVSKILQHMNKVFPLNLMPLSPDDQLSVRERLYVDDTENVCYGRFKLPENPTNDIVQQNPDLLISPARQDVINMSHAKRICNKNGQVFVLLTT